MLQFLWLIPALPFAGFLILALGGRRLSRVQAAAVGVGSVGLSMVLTILIGARFIGSPPGNAPVQVLWTWMSVGGFRPEIAFRLDALSLTMTAVITVVGFLIHLYSSEFMAGDEGYSRFFAYMNLFVGAMLTLVLADNLLLLYFGWEGVGLCSYLLIGFWYKDPYNGYAARKAFVVTRVGDTAMGIGLFLLFNSLGTLRIQELMQAALQQWGYGHPLAAAAAALLLGGAVGKSAQLPLQTWLPDAMAGPTPVSALIHAATMVTAGVYLIARTHLLFSLAPMVQAVVAAIGAATLLIAGFSALVQSDIKRVLAYSTISQIGYMFLALGVGAWSAAVFHFMTHAFFKALLFLGAGVVIISLHHEHDMFRMGGLRRQLPLTFWTFLIGAASLSALPLVTAGYYSKDLILYSAWVSKIGSPVLWFAGLAGALLTALYSFRMVFITFFGTPKGHAEHKPGLAMKIPLVILAVLSVIGGFVETPPFLGDIRIFSKLMHSVLPPDLNLSMTGTGELILEVGAALTPPIGVLLAYLLYLYRPGYAADLMRAPHGSALHRFWFSGWGFDRLYDRLFVRPFLWLARLNKDDVLDLPYLGLIWAGRGVNDLLVHTQTGKVRLYAAGIVVGAILALSAMVFL